MTPARQAAVNSLAVVGFIALVAAGILLAVYSTRFVPTVVNRIGAAAVYLGSVFTPSPDAGLSIVPTPSATSTISFGNGTTTSPSVSTTTAPSGEKPAPAPGPKTTTVQPIGTGVVAPQALYGLPDLQIVVTAIGYLNTASADSFVASPTVPDGERPAVKFTVRNVGTNVSGTWRFEASIPTRGTFDYESPLQQALNPGDSIDYTLGFDRARSGANQPISITANFDNRFAEANTSNNTISLNITVLD